jgi:hypothetical protein
MRGMPKPLHKKAARIVVEARQRNGIAYQLELVRCGKKGCRCARRAAHGPYWYSYRRVGGRVISLYVGRELPNVRTLEHRAERAAFDSPDYHAAIAALHKALREPGEGACGCNSCGVVRRRR